MPPGNLTRQGRLKVSFAEGLIKCLHFQASLTFSTRNVDKTLKTMWTIKISFRYTTDLTLCLFFMQLFYDVNTVTYQIVYGSVYFHALLPQPH